MNAFDELREELRKLPAPDAPTHLLSRILTSRASGVRIVLPLGDPTSIPGARPRVAAAALVAAATLLAVLIGRDVRPSTEGAWSASPDEFLSDVPLWPRAAHAQAVTDTTARAKYPLLDVIDGTRLGRGRWTYAAHLITDGVDTSSQGTRTYTVTPGSEPGTLILATAQTHRYARPRRDSLVVRLPELRLVHYVFSGPDTSGTVDLSRDTVPRHLTFESLDISWRTRSLALLQALPLHRDWRGSVYRPWLVGDNRWVVSPLDLRVIGDEVVATPAGRFDCWKLDARFRNRRLLVWVGKSPRWVVKLAQRHGGDAAWEQVLTAYSPVS
jgi:hypothetical protein